jgi:hypothetical protein
VQRLRQVDEMVEPNICTGGSACAWVEVTEFFARALGVEDMDVEDCSSLGPPPERHVCVFMDHKRNLVFIKMFKWRPKPLYELNPGTLHQSVI